MKKLTVETICFKELKKLTILEYKFIKKSRRLTPDEYADKIIKEIEYLEKHNNGRNY